MICKNILYFILIFGNVHLHNCKWVDKCITYHHVEENHDVTHICTVPDFKAKNPFIHVSLNKDINGNYKTEWDVRDCESFSEELGKWSKLNPGLELPV